MYERAAPEPHEDGRMVSDFARGTASGLERVYAAYGKPLYSVALRVLGNEDEAQDCVHDALLRIWQRPGSYRLERGSLRSYLLVSIRNEALTRKRNAARHSHIEERAAQDERSAYELHVNDPVERARLQRALGELPAEQKTALELVYFGHLTHVEAAERLGAPLGTIKSRVALALRKLHAAMSTTGAELR